MSPVASVAPLSAVASVPAVSPGSASLPVASPTALSPVSELRLPSPVVSPAVTPHANCVTPGCWQYPHSQAQPLRQSALESQWYSSPGVVALRPSVQPKKARTSPQAASTDPLKRMEFCRMTFITLPAYTREPR